jgi:CBS domain-containing protein
MGTVRSVLQGKGHSVWSIGPEASVHDALKLMAEKNVGALLVLDQGDCVGIISERDYARKVELNTRSAKDTRVSEIMTRSVICVRPEQTVDECMALMTDKHIRHLPVSDGGALIGVISIGDVVKELIAEKEFMIQQLENYIKKG